jgi:cell division protein ZapA (FtsZ GTPase activity inhibitor)
VLFGQKNTFRAEGNVSNIEQVEKKIIKEVSKIEKSLESRSLYLDNLTKLLLATLNISGDYVKLKEGYDNLLKDINSKSDKILKFINQAVF